MTGPGLAHKGGRTRPVLKLALFSAAFLSLAAATLMFIGQRQFIYDPSHRAPKPGRGRFRPPG